MFKRQQKDIELKLKVFIEIMNKDDLNSRLSMAFTFSFMVFMNLSF